MPNKPVSKGLRAPTYNAQLCQGKWRLRRGTQAAVGAENISAAIRLPGSALQTLRICEK